MNVTNKESYEARKFLSPIMLRYQTTHLSDNAQVFYQHEISFNKEIIFRGFRAILSITLAKVHLNFYTITHLIVFYFSRKHSLSLMRIQVIPTTLNETGSIL